jgi:hypothetical protein
MSRTGQFWLQSIAADLLTVPVPSFAANSESSLPVFAALLQHLLPRAMDWQLKGREVIVQRIMASLESIGAVQRWKQPAANAGDLHG